MTTILLTIQLLYCKIFQRPLFIIKIEDTVVKKISGDVKSSFMADCIEIIDRNNVTSGLIYAFKGQYGKPVLHVYGAIPDDILQQLRNTWAIHA
jgi:Protein of unknown function (DUF3634)